MMIRTAFALVLCTVTTLPGVAQEMPSWAAPVEAPPPPPPRDRRLGPDLPEDPDPVPLQGLALLALAGAGYAVRRLRQ